MRSRTAPLALLLLFAPPASGDEPPPRPALTITLAHPDREAGRVIALFRGSRAADPAQALAAWKRASREPTRLGKPLEAAIAAINPRMAAELRTLDGAEVSVGFGGKDSPPSWTAWLPRDDGTFAALASALTLSGGAAEPPIGAVAVDRLGPVGSPLMARGPSALVVAGTRRDLEAGLARPGRSVPGPEATGPAWRAAIDPDALAAGGRGLLPFPLRALVASGCRGVEATAGVTGTALEIASEARFEAAPSPAVLAVDPGWLDLIPGDRAVTAAAFALDPTAWDAAFALADRVEKGEPGRSDVAPSRVRLGLLARAFGVRVEADVVPHLRGVSGWAGAAPGGPIDRGAIAAHFEDEAAAIRVQGRIKPRPSIEVARRGRTVLVAWGEGSIGDSLDALDHPGRSAGPNLRSGWGNAIPCRAGGLWPGRVPGLVPASSPLAAALAEAPPVVWTGRSRGTIHHDRLRWEGLDATIRRFLDLLPLDPPPDR